MPLITFNNVGKSMLVGGSGLCAAALGPVVSMCWEALWGRGGGQEGGVLNWARPMAHLESWILTDGQDLRTVGLTFNPILLMGKATEGQDLPRITMAQASACPSLLY